MRYSNYIGTGHDFWLDLYVLTDFFGTCKYPSPEYSKYFRSTKNLYVCERFLEQIQHILCTPVTMVYGI